MRSALLRHRSVLILVLLAMLAAMPAAPALADDGIALQVKTGYQLGDETVDAQKAAAAAVALSQLEANGDYATLYSRLHPDSRSIVPEAAVVGWYAAQNAGKTTAEMTVTGVTFVDWTWGVNGRRYPRTAEIAYTQPYWTDGVREDQSGLLHLVEYRGDWGWFFGATPEFVDQEIALYAPGFALPDASANLGGETALQRAQRFPDPLHANIDAFWADAFAKAGVPYTPPRGVVPFDATVQTSCGEANPDEDAAFYCVADDTIYYSARFRTLVEQQIGDFGWVVVVAHEWGHHVQQELGVDLGRGQTDRDAPLALEQQADCLAGAYTENAEQTGWLDPGDVDEALFMTEISGDPPGTAWDDPQRHGTGEARKASFLSGYDGGIPACGLTIAAPAP